MTAPSSEGAYVGQGQGLSLRYVVVCSVSLATAFGCLSLTVQLLLFRKNHARLACSVVNALTTAHCRYQLLRFIGQPQGLSLRVVRNYRFKFLRLAKDCKGSNPINNLQKITVQCLSHHTVILWRRARDFFGLLPYAFASLRSLTTDFQTVHRTVFIGVADRPCSNPLLKITQRKTRHSKRYTLFSWRRARDSAHFVRRKVCYANCPIIDFF